MSGPLEFTGERFTPECVREIRYEHVHRYVFARSLVAGRAVLDAACGEGYGSALLAETAASVAGVDVSGEAIAHAQSRYQAPNLEFHEANCLELPFEDGRFDCIVSFETLEHLEEQEQLLEEFRRVLRPGGFLLISTPDKAVYTDTLGNRNEFHVAELYRDEFESMLVKHFSASRLWGQKLGFQSTIWSLGAGSGVTFHSEKSNEVTSTPRPQHAAVYLLALCAASEQDLPELPNAVSLFDDAGESVYAHYHHEIRKNIEAGGILARRDQEIATLKAALARTQAQVQEQAKPAAGPWWRRLLGKG